MKKLVIINHKVKNIITKCNKKIQIFKIKYKLMINYKIKHKF